MVKPGVKCPCCGKSFVLDDDANITTDYDHWGDDWDGDEEIGVIFYCKDCDQEFDIIFKIDYRQFEDRNTREVKRY